MGTQVALQYGARFPYRTFEAERKIYVFSYRFYARLSQYFLKFVVVLYGTRVRYRVSANRVMDGYEFVPYC